MEGVRRAVMALALLAACQPWPPALPSLAPPAHDSGAGEVLGEVAEPAPVPTVPPDADLLACIRSYEGGYTSVSADGTYRGAYQADEATWAGYGGYTYADEAPPDVQDAFARELLAERGLQPWPTPERMCA
jgi:hypothetical protein